MRLEEIGFYTLSDARARGASSTSPMWRCEMIITEACNFKCPYCRGLAPWVYEGRAKRMLSIDEIRRNIDLWSPLKNIRFSGGEPTTHPWLIDAVEYAKAKGVERIAISTNGSAALSFYVSLIAAGCSDFSISLDACCAMVGDRMAGTSGAWEKVVRTIREVSAAAYATVGIVFTPANTSDLIETVCLAHGLGVSDIRIISSAQFNERPTGLNGIPQEILDAHPILAYRVANFLHGRNVRGIEPGDSKRCSLVLDDSVIAGDYHFPCVIYMREGGRPIGRVSADMREERTAWRVRHDTHSDAICRDNCLDVCIDYNNRMAKEAPDA